MPAALGAADGGGADFTSGRAHIEAPTVFPVRNKRHEERTIRMDAEPLPPL